MGVRGLNDEMGLGGWSNGVEVGIGSVRVERLGGHGRVEDMVGVEG